jgi:hypothetical protein
VDLILAGHLHRAYVGNSLDVYSGQDREHGIIIAQCGTSTSRRGRGLEQEKNTFNWIKLDNQTIQIEHFMYFSDQQKNFTCYTAYFCTTSLRLVTDVVARLLCISL